MKKFAFKGVPGEAHAALTMYGLTFVLGVPVVVGDPKVIDKLSNHPHFETVGDDAPEELSELDKLRQRAVDLGIEVKANWGEKALTKAIAEAQGK